MRAPADFPYVGFETRVLRLVVSRRLQTGLLVGAYFSVTKDFEEPPRKLNLSLFVPLDLARLEVIPDILEPGVSFEVHCMAWGRVQTFSPCLVSRASRQVRMDKVDHFGLAGFAEGWDETQ
jgi:hypothetical protein